MARSPRNASADEPAPVQAMQRLDKWLWFARVAKTRTLAAALVTDGRVRVNRTRTTKPAQPVRAGDVVTVTVARGVRVLKILDGGTRRGPAAEAAGLYEEIVPLPSSSRREGAGAEPRAGGPVVEPGGGRPTKRERRKLDGIRARFED